MIPLPYSTSECNPVKLSARNQPKGVVSEVRKGAVTTIVKIEVKHPAIISASITNEAAE
jgi:molybdopterin-binding protein